MYEPTEQDKAYAKEKGIAEELRVLKGIQYRENNIQKRKNKGLKLNRVTTGELKMVLQHWFENGRKPLTRSFEYVYNNTDKLYKETDWVDAILRSKSYGKELTSAFNGIDTPESITLKTSELFDITLLKSMITLSKRICKMGVDLKYEDRLVAKDLEITKLKGLLKTGTWQEKAIALLLDGNTQKVVAELTGKSVITIARLVAKNKELLNEPKD